MYDYFNMAYQDNANAVHLNIKVNSENLLPISQKYNAGSLRVPADPSWPKIPPRKLIDNMDDTIEPPCIVTLTGTPRRSRTVVQTPLNQSPKSTITKDSAYSSFNQQWVTSSIHTLKKHPGYIDPRFKKVTSSKKNQFTNSMEPPDNKKIEKSIPEKDVNMQQVKVQGTEKLHDMRKNEETNVKTDSRENKDLNIDQKPTIEQKHCVNYSESKNIENTSDNVGKSKLMDRDNCVKNTSCCESMSKSMMNDANTQVDVTSLPVQDNNGQLFFVLDKKFQSHPLNSIHLDTVTVPQEYVNQCYSIQVPVLTYKNIPMQISPTTGTNTAIQQGLSNSEYICQPNIASSTKKEMDTKISNQMQNMNKPLDIEKKSVGEKNVDNNEKNIIKIPNTGVDKGMDNCFNPNDNASVMSAKASVNPNASEKLESTKIQQTQRESSDSEYYIPNTIKKNVQNSVLQRLHMKKTVYNTSGNESTDSEFIIRKDIQKKEFIDVNKLAVKTNKNKTSVHGDTNLSHNHDETNFMLKKRGEYLESVPQTNVTNQEAKTVMYETQARNKSEQHLPCSKIECSKKLCRNSEPYIAFKQKKASTKFSRKARSYFQKNSHSALADSDYTLVWANSQSNKHKCSQTNVHKFNNYRTKKINYHPNAKLSAYGKNITTQIENNLNGTEQSYLQNDQDIDSCQEMVKNPSKVCLQKECCKCNMSPRTNTDDVSERPKGISPKTQELLNKSYWEYYNKLRHKIKNPASMEQQYLYQLTIDASEAKKGKTNEIYNQELQGQLKLNPELQTLQQCSALSTMINKALDSNLQSDAVQTKQMYLNRKSSSNPMINNQNTNTIPNLFNNELSLDKVKYQKNKETDTKFLELKSIIFFGGMMYILIIFLPMLYDYFYQEEYDDYENWSYLELIVDYVLSSFKEAFGGVFNAAKQIFFYPHRCKKCNNIA